MMTYRLPTTLAALWALLWGALAYDAVTIVAPYLAA